MNQGPTITKKKVQIKKIKGKRQYWCQYAGLTMPEKRFKLLENVKLKKSRC